MITNPVIKTSIGSVGKDKPEPPVRSVKLTDKGVAATINHIAQSNLYRVSQTTSMPTGSNNSSHHSLAITKATIERTTPARTVMPLFVI